MRYYQTQAFQQKYRCAAYTSVINADPEDVENLPGKRILLPSAHCGSPMWYHNSFLDAMSIVRKLGKPDLFITFTCNPEWREIQESIFPGERPADRPDIISRVFYRKVQQLIDMITKQDVFGKAIGLTATKEDQKRGLPHIHLLVILKTEDKPRTSTSVDKLIRAEIPDEQDEPELFRIVQKFNIHGPCGPSDDCHKDSKGCRKGFPKSFNNSATNFDGNYYPRYRRRDVPSGGKTCQATRYGKTQAADNSYVVPYSPLLSLRFEAHINVEIVESVAAVKYLYKYLTKGSDKTSYKLTSDGTVDEISRFQDGRYVTSGDAFCRIYRFPVLWKLPAVSKLQIHLEDEQVVIFTDSQSEEVADRSPPISQLMAYFELNKKDHEARHVLYPDIFQHYRWINKEKSWQKRKLRQSRRATGAMSDEIGRIPFIPYSEKRAELFYMRMLLYQVCGATSFEALRTVSGELCRTFKEACLKLGLLEDDEAIIKVLHEACGICFGSLLRELFVTVLVFCEPKDPLRLWDCFKDKLVEDVRRKRGEASVGETDLEIALWMLQELLRDYNHDLSAFDLPTPGENIAALGFEFCEDSYDIPALKAILKRNYEMMTEEQRSIFDPVLEAIDSETAGAFLLDAPAGSGKTFLITTLIAAVRATDRVAIATATSGIAALLLPHGRTAHSQLKIPIELTDTSMCDIQPKDATAQQLRSCKLLIIDEFSMAHKHLYEAVDRTLRDITGRRAIFGGIPVVLSGDWRQILPVVIRGSDADVVSASLKRSYLWNELKVLHLKKNMRLAGNNSEFSEYLLNIGEGKIEPDSDGYIPLPQQFRLRNNSLAGLCNFVYPNFAKNCSNADWLCSRAILCATNEIVGEVNEFIVSKLQTECKEYRSTDVALDTENDGDYPLEFLNKLNPSGLPPHLLKVKLRSPIMLLRNLDTKRGHCNGTRYIANGFTNHIIDATIAFGPHVGKRKLIPRIRLTSSDKHMPFALRRHQFPIKLCFGMTFNKAQGQSLQQHGLYLKQDVFAHGQLYVALSRAKDPSQLRIVRPENNKKMLNVVYQQIFE